MYYEISMKFQQPEQPFKTNQSIDHVHSSFRMQQIFSISHRTLLSITATEINHKLMEVQT